MMVRGNDLRMGFEAEMEKAGWLKTVTLHASLFIRYDTIRQKSLTWTRKLSIQLYLAHVARKRN